MPFPGRSIPVWFRPIKTGEWEVVCAQLCGGGHYAMKAMMTIEKQADFDRWFKETSDLQHPAAAAAPPTAQTLTLSDASARCTRHEIVVCQVAFGGGSLRV